MEVLQQAPNAMGEASAAQEAADACADARNAVEAKLGSFADDHSTL
ncbi:MAG TPA: hypothetical protein VGI11_07245 [Variovorax sp.]|jgi:hypothetical protein